MSRIPDLGEKFSKLPKILGEYEDALDGFEKHLNLEGKTIEFANREQAAWQSYYDQKRIELHTLVKYMEGQTDRIRGRLFKTYTENYSRELSDRAKDKYIDHEEAYIQQLELYLEVKEICDKYEAVVDAFRARGFALRNITQIRVASLEDVVL